MNYKELSLHQWQQISKDACNALDNYTKTQAQTFFFNFMDPFDLQKIIQLIQVGSDTLIFVLFSYIKRRYASLTTNMNNIVSLIHFLAQWTYENGTFIRPNFPPLKKYAANTIFSAIGTLLKYLFDNEHLREIFVPFLKEFPPSTFKLVFMKYFIEEVGTVDMEMGFIKYRFLISRFQEQILPFSIQILSPFLNNIEQHLRIAQLQVLQENINLSEQNILKNNDFKIQQQYKSETQTIIIFLKQILQFNYNISYSQYESNNVSDQCLIGYPEKVLNKIIEPQFIRAIVYITEKVVEKQLGEKKNTYLKIVLDCLIRIMQARVSFIKEDLRQIFFIECIKASRSLLAKCRQVGSQFLLAGIFKSNKKLLISTSLGQIKRCVEKNPIAKNNNIYEKYIEEIMTLIAQVVENSPIKFDNTLIQQGMDLMLKIVQNIGFQQQCQRDQQHIYFSNMTKNIIQKFILNLTKTGTLFNSKLLDIADNKQQISQIFSNFKQIATSEYKHTFNTIQKCLSYYFHNKNETTIFSNLLMLMSTLLDRGFMDRGIFMNRAKDEELVIFHNLLKASSEVIETYFQSKTVYVAKDSDYLDVAAILFTQSITLQFLVGFEMQNKKIRLKHRILNSKNQLSNGLQTAFNKTKQNNEDILVYYINFLFHFLQSNVTHQQDEIKIRYVLDTLEKIIFKIKWGMKRQLFVKSKIFKHLVNFYEEYYKKFSQVLSLRKRISKVIVTLCFDDTLDQYRNRIQRLIFTLKGLDLNLLIFDLTGLFDSIETVTIVTYFHIKLKKAMNLPQFFNYSFDMAIQKNTQDSYTTVIKLGKAILTNRSLRYCTAPLNYEYFNMILPQYLKLLKILNSRQQIDINIWNDPLHQLLDTFSTVFCYGNLNISLVSQYQNAPIKQFLVLMLSVVLKLMKFIENIPKMEDTIYQFIIVLNRDMIDFLYSQPSQISDLCSEMIIATSKISISYLVNVHQGTKLKENSFSKTLQIMKYFYTFLISRGKMIHHQVKLMNLNRFLTNFTQQSQIYLYYLILYSLNYSKQLSLNLRAIARVIFKILMSPFREAIDKILEKIKISQRKKQDFVQICRQSLHKQQEESFIGQLKKWMQQSDE